MENFFSPNLNVDLRSDAHRVKLLEGRQMKTILKLLGGYSQIIGGIYSPILPGCRHPWLQARGWPWLQSFNPHSGAFFDKMLYDDCLWLVAWNQK